MADVVLRHQAGERVLADGTVLADRLDVSSAGTGGWHAGEPMDPRAVAALGRRGYVDHGHRARAFDTSWFDSVDLVVCMDRGHRQNLAGLARARSGHDEFEDRLVLMRTFGNRGGGDPDVHDPYYDDDAGFDACLDVIEVACAGLADHLGSTLDGPGLVGVKRR